MTFEKRQARALIMLAAACITISGCARPALERDSLHVGQAAEMAAIRTARNAQNRAIATGDTAEAARYWTGDVEIRRGLGQLVVGRNAYQRLLVPDAAAVESGTALTYERTPASVEVSAQWPLAYETGEWTGHLAGASRLVVTRGRYSAQWVKRGTRWLIRGEVYVALSCAGAGCTYSAAS